MFFYLIFPSIFYFFLYTKWHANRDLNFIYNVIYDNHPGIINNDFKENLGNCFSESRKKILDCSYFFVDKSFIIDFIKKFQDPHLRVEFYYSDEFNFINYLKKLFYKLFEKKTCKKIDFKEIPNNKYYLKLETFCPNKDEELRLKKISEKLEVLSNVEGSILIIDLRNNGGGDTRYCNQILEAIFGKHYFYQNLYQNQKNEFARYCVSKNNVEHFVNIWKLIKGENGEFLMNSQINRLIDAYEKGYAFCDIYEWDEDLFKYSENKYYCEKVENDSKVKIKVLINRFVGSAALDFLDYLYYMNYKNIVLIGESTDYDTFYMDCRSVELPSGKGKLIFPQKEIFNRKRKSGQRYFPEIEMRDKDIDNFFLLNCQEQ
jgi:hypothetical protein